VCVCARVNKKKTSESYLSILYLLCCSQAKQLSYRYGLVDVAAASHLLINDAVLDGDDAIAELVEHLAIHVVRMGKKRESVQFGLMLHEAFD